MAALLYTLVATAEGEEPNILIPSTPELVWGAICFLVVFLPMAFFVFPRIKKALNEREGRIRGSLESAEAAKAEADGILEEYRAKLADARRESGTIIEEARKQAEEMRRQLMSKAEQDAADLVAKAREGIEAERMAAIGAVRREAAAFSVELAERIVRRSVDRDAQTRLIEDYIRELESMPRG